MSVWNNIRSFFKRDKVTATKIIDLLNQGYSIFQISSDLYNIPEIRTAINFIAEKVACVPFNQTKEDSEGNLTTITGRNKFVLTVRTNPYHCPQVFWTYAVTRMLLYNNAFIMPEWDFNGNLKWLWVLPFSEFTFSADEEGKVLITFPAGNSATFYYDDIIHLQKFPSQKGGIRRHATGNYVQIVNTLQAQAVKDSETSGRLAALLQVKTALKGTDMLKKLNEFKDLFLNSENTTGFGMIGAEYEVVKLDPKIPVLNTDVLKEIIKLLYNYFGVSAAMVAGTAGELEFEQGIENAVKPIVYQIEEELTYKILSDAEINRGNRIEGELVDLEISTLSAKTAFYKEMVYGAIMNRNEIRKRLRMPRGPAELDKFLENKNFQVLGAGNYVVKGGEEDGQKIPADVTA